MTAPETDQPKKERWCRQGMFAAGIALVVLAVGLSLCSTYAEDEEDCAVLLQPGDSIQTAIESADVDAILCLAPGVYQELLVITKSITLRGMGETPEDVEIKGTSRSEPGISIHNPEDTEEPFEVTFENITLSNRYPAKFHGIEVEGTAGIVVSNSQILGCMRYGLVLRDSTTAAIYSSTLGDSTNGVLFKDESQVTLVGCTFTKTKRIELEGDCVVTMDQCDMGSTNIVASGRSRLAAINSALKVLVLSSNTDTRLTDCTIKHCTMEPIMANISAKLRMTGCVVEANSYGIRLEGNSESTIDECVFADNAYTPLFLGESATLHITNCEFLRNAGFGIATWTSECGALCGVPSPGSMPDDFEGRLSGSANTIPGPDEPDGNTLGDVCPDSFHSVKD